MAKINLKAALSKSVKDEGSHIEKRFAKAEGLLGEKPKPAPKEKVVRDTYSMPVGDYGLIQRIQDNWLKLGISATRSEIVRAGILVLSMADKKDVERALAGLVKLKPGRGKNS